MKLICLPFAGGNAQSYMEWKEYLGNEIKLVTIDYAGHGSRFCEELTESYQSTLDDIYSRIVAEIDEEYSLFGHSMGAIYVYEIAKMIEKSKLRKPSRIIVSGTEAPYEQDKKILHKLPRREFMQEMYELGGMPEELMLNVELSDVFYPILQNDIKNMELYRVDHKDMRPEKLNLPLIVLWGTDDDEFGKEEIMKWQKYSCFPNITREFEGGHFFIYEKKEEVCRFLKKLLLYY